MSTALRSTVPFSLSVPRLSGLARRLDAVSTMHVGAAALIVLVGGLLLSIATTSDPLWWQLHFSQLGIFGDLSSAFFNTTLKVSGMIVVVFAFRVRRDVRRVGRGPVRRGAATVAFICLNVVGVNLALVGCIPLNTDKDLHDKVAGSMVLGFLALLLSAPFLFHRLGKRMAIGTGIATAWLIVSITLFVSATINLALFETISCAAMFAWSGMFTHILASATPTVTRAQSAPADAADRLAKTRHTSARRPLRAARVSASARPARVSRSIARARRTLEVGTSRPIAPSRLVRRPDAVDRADAARRAETSRPTAETGPGRRRAASRTSAVSASRAARVGSSGARRRSPARQARPLAPPVDRGAVRSLLR